MSDLSIPLKRCTKCGNEFLATTEFFHKRGDRDAFRSHCRACVHEANRTRLQQRRTENPDWAREKGRSDQKLFRQRNSARVSVNDRARRRRRFEKDPDRERARERRKWHRWIVNNRDKQRVRVRRSQDKRRQYKFQNTVGPAFTVRDVELQRKAQNNHCWWCSKALKDTYHIDHRIPLSRGGSNSAENICLTCPTCNLSKNNKLPWEWNGRLL